MPFIDLYVKCPGCGYRLVWGPGVKSHRSIHRRHTTKEQLEGMLRALERKLKKQRRKK